MVWDQIKGWLGISDKGSHRVETGTGKIQKHNSYDQWDDVGTRINPDSGVIETSTYGNYGGGNTRVAPDGTVQERIAYDQWGNTGVRIEGDGRITKENSDGNGYGDTGLRINRETGKLQRRGSYDAYWDVEE
jgi:hypothetical protein